jgi:3-oxoacyl-[acyl-carrier-protein] synthase II
VNLEVPDPEMAFDCVPGQAREAAVGCAISNSFGFGGQNVSLVFRRAC